jgi:hypothetical protein
MTSIKQIIAQGQTAPVIENEIVKYTNYEIKPIAVEDAKLKLEEKEAGSLFYTFINVETGKVSVLYSRADKDLGLIEVDY